MLSEAQLTGTHFALSVGMEGIGVVTRIGPGVSGFTVGEPRFVSFPGMGRHYVTTSVDAGLIEAGQDLNLEACGSVVALMTAHYALKHAAHVQPGEWVLVASGAGGVGMAAVQIAAKPGARVIATASTPERAEVLRTFGAEHVVNSRPLSAIDEVRQLTGGHGADVVISSAPGGSPPRTTSGCPAPRWAA
jgi:NADPH:quinone reductase-like Zn-dependent oxidoreductase